MLVHELFYLFPLYYVWETRSEHADKLLMVPDGMDYTNPRPFPAHRFIIALNTTGSDHPIYNSIFYSLIGYFAAAKYGLPWMQEFCQRYGHPVFQFSCSTEDEIANLRAQLDENEDIYRVFLRGDSSMTVTPIPAAAANPHEALLRVAENACHQAILGQTLTSDASANGGSRAQAEVHLGVQKSVVMKRAEYVARVLNRQLVPAIIAMNYGKTDGVPMPEIKFSLPDDGANIERAAYWAQVLAIPGISIAKETIYESLRLPMPGEGDDCLGGEKPAQSMSGARNNDDDDPDDDPPPNTPPKGAPAVDEVKSAAAAPEPAAALSQYSAAAREKLRQWLAEGVPLQEIRARLRELKLDTRALASALSTQYQAAATGEKLTAAAAGDCRSPYPPDCRNHGNIRNKGTTREGETKQKKHVPNEKRESNVVAVKKTYNYRRQAKQILTYQAKEMQGATAPGMNKSFHITSKSVKELTSGGHAQQSDSYEAHYTAAVNALKLWAHSEPFEPPHDKERDRYNSYKESPLEWVYYRKAIMEMNGEAYAVKITAKEYKGQSLLPIIYQVKAKKMRGLHTRGGIAALPSSTAQVDYDFFCS